MGDHLQRSHGVLLPLMISGMFILSLVVGACVGVENRSDSNDEVAEGQIERDLERAGEHVDQGLRDLGDAVERTGEEIEEEVGPEVRRIASDAGVTARIKARLTADPEINPILIDVDTVNGKVTLTGTVPTQEVKDEAEDLARGTEGVVSVDNLLQVVPS